MKLNNILKSLALFSVLTVSFLGCEDEYLNHVPYSIYEWADNDAEGGQWKPVLISTPTQFEIPTPLPFTDAAYQKELQDAATLIANATQSDKDEALYWGNNPMVRWNEITRELAAKYNLAPAPNPDGTFPVPSAANPGVYPFFPWTHPPFASRMYAYLSAATFDAMIVTWNAKYKYNRPAAYKNKSDIVPLFGQTTLPSYPSDGATAAACAKAILQAMFPLEKDYISERYDNCLKALKIGGHNVQSDIDAGALIGQNVAVEFINRSKTDGMSKAQAPKTVADSIKNAAINKYGWFYQSLEVPERKIGLNAMFGQVKTWTVTNLEAIRSPVPPSFDSEKFKESAQELVDIQDNLTKEQRRIAIFWADGTNTYTPPGHWNRIACDAIVEAKMNPLRTARTLAYMNMSVQDAGIACWETKYHYHYPRPNQKIEGFKTLLGTPNFPGYVSGHSTFSAGAAGVLSYIFPNKKDFFEAWADEASKSRIYGGIHFDFDCSEGLILGYKVASITVERAKADGSK